MIDLYKLKLVSETVKVIFFYEKIIFVVLQVLTNFSNCIFKFFFFFSELIYMLYLVLHNYHLSYIKLQMRLFKFYHVLELMLRSNLLLSLCTIKFDHVL